MGLRLWKVITLFEKKNKKIVSQKTIRDRDTYSSLLSRDFFFHYRIKKTPSRALILEFGADGGKKSWRL